MSTPLHIEHIFENIAPALFEEYLHHPSLVAALQNLPAFQSRELIETTSTTNGKKWRFRVVANGNVPAPLRKALPQEMLTWWEDTVWDAKQHTILWSVEPIHPSMRERFQATGAWQLFPHGSQGTKRIIRGTFDVHIPLIGGAIEKFLVSEFLKNYQTEPRIQKEFFISLQKNHTAHSL